MRIAGLALPVIVLITMGVIWPQDPGATLTLLNDPVQPYVKLSAAVESGKLVLQLQNGYHKPITIQARVIRRRLRLSTSSARRPQTRSGRLTEGSRCRT